jgi:hypothetical protein
MSAIRTGGDGMRVTFDVPETDMPQALHLVAMRSMVLTVTVKAGDEIEAKARKERKEAKPKGPHGHLWAKLHNLGFIHEPNLKRFLEAERGDNEFELEDTLRRLLGVKSRSYISADDLVAWLKSVSEGSGIPMGNAIKMVTAAEQKVSGR